MKRVLSNTPDENQTRFTFDFSNGTHKIYLVRISALYEISDINFSRLKLKKQTVQTLNKNKTREIYKLVQQITLKELGEKIDETVNQKEEQEFYLALYNYKLGVNQQKVLRKQQ